MWQNPFQYHMRAPATVKQLQSYWHYEVWDKNNEFDSMIAASLFAN